jgi:glycolate oxidase iron-sulfur subunit
MDSPRGRLYLMRAAAEGRIGLTENFVTHMDRCLGCRACESACPSGVPFGRLLETVRGQIERHVPRPLSRRVLRRLVLGVFPHRARLRAALAVLGAYRASGLQRLVRASGLLRPFPRLAAMEALVPGDWPRARRRLPARLAAAGQSRGTAALLTGCVQSLLFPEVNEASAVLLARAGYDVVMPPAQGCCGALHLHWGARDEARALARANLVAFAGADWVVTNAAGCGAALREYGHLLPDAGAALADRVRDVTELLAGALPGPRQPLDLTVTYHEPCHLAHGQRVREAPRQLLRAVPGLRLVELGESDVCCGSAGVYNLLEPDLARKLLARKLDRIAATRAEVVVSGNPGCLLQLRMGLAERGLAVRALHPVELLWWSVEGRDAGSRPGAGRAMPRAALLVTCLVDLLYPDVGVATVRLLRGRGVEVSVPQGQTCCGLPLFNSEDGAPLAADRLREVAAGADLGLTAADLAIAETGSLVLVSGSGRSRSVSLLPPVHVAVFGRDQLVGSLAEAGILLQGWHAAPPAWVGANVVVITGPSRTADIELTLTRGVHGPKEVHALFVDSL